MSDLEGEYPQHAPVTGDIQQLLDALTETVERAKSMPLSSSAIISRDEVLELLEAARAAVPDELQRARRMLLDHDALRVAAERESVQLIDEARAQAAHLVQRTEIVRQARNEAERLVADADADSRRIRHEAEDYVDRKLAAFEIVLDRTIRTVQAGRERLTAPPVTSEVEAVAGVPEPDTGLFDQDLG